MTTEVTKTQIDRLGDRLRKGDISEADLRLLDSYRRSFSEAYQVVVEAITKELALEPTGRPAKSTTSISDKLRRESIRLTQIQDIAGCRLIVPDIAYQESVVQSLVNLFEHATIIDRRPQPSHGYRAVHVIVSCHGKLIEVQVRTSLQHLWAELSEKLSDIVGPEIKYGGGDEGLRPTLMDTSSAIARIESLETQLADLQVRSSSRNYLTNDKKQEAFELLSNAQKTLDEALRGGIKRLEEIKGEYDALSD